MQCPFEKKTVVNAPAMSTPQILAQTVRERLDIHPVEVINNEVICAAQTLQGAIAVLIHFRVNAGGAIETTIKSTASEVGDLLISQLLPAAFSNAGPVSAPSGGLPTGLLF